MSVDAGSDNTPSRPLQQEQTLPPRDAAISSVEADRPESAPEGATSQKPSLRDVKENHPLFVLCGAVVVAGGIVAGVMQYFQAQSLKALDERHSRTLAATTEPLIADIARLKSTNEQLLTELGSVERTVGGETKLFDIRQLIVGPDKLKALPSSLQYYDDLRFYAVTPTNPPWKSEKMSEFAFMSLFQGREYAERIAALLGHLPIHEQNIRLWRSPDTIKIGVDPNANPVAEMLGLSPPSQVSLFAFVAVQKFDRALLSKTIAVVAPPSQTGNETEDVDDSVIEQHQLEVLDRTFASDIAGAMMAAQSQAIMGVAQGYKDTVFSIENVQKRGPVLYMNARVTFQQAKISGRPGKHLVRWDREIIVVAVRDTAYMVMTSIPTIDDGRSASYGSVQQWLSSLRIPVEI